MYSKARETGAASERTIRRKSDLFDEGGMQPLFVTEKAKRKRLPRWICGMIVKLKGEHPPLNPNEIASIVYVRTGRKVDRKPSRTCCFPTWMLSSERRCASRHD
jgi:hypothetical protein